MLLIEHAKDAPLCGRMKKRLRINGYMSIARLFFSEMKKISYHIAAGKIWEDHLYGIQNAFMKGTYSCDEKFILRILRYSRRPGLINQSNAFPVSTLDVPSVPFVPWWTQEERSTRKCITADNRGALYPRAVGMPCRVDVTDFSYIHLFFPL